MSNSIVEEYEMQMMWVMVTEKPASPIIIFKWLTTSIYNNVKLGATSFDIVMYV